MTTEFNENQTLKNIIDTQNDTIKTYHNIMMMQETEIARLKERIKELEATEL